MPRSLQRHAAARDRSPARPSRRRATPPAADAGTASRRARPALRFPVVGIGASAGGLAAISTLLDALPPEPGMAFVVVSHLDRSHHSLLDSVLGKKTRMPVLTVKQGAPVRPNRVYVVTPNVLVAIRDGRLRTSPLPEGSSRPTTIDHFLISLAEDQGALARGVVLSGLGSDGTLGLKRIRKEGGVTYAEEPRTAQFADMPVSAIKAGCVDYVLTPQQIAEQLVQSATPVPAAPIVIAAPADAEHNEAGFRDILDELFKVGGVDFSHYKPSMLRRRIARRMAAQRITDLASYRLHLAAHPEEAQALHEDMLIHVSDFFRDPAAFRALQRRVIAPLAAERDAGEPIRVWVPGCARGEEVYTLGMLLLEALAAARRPRRIQLFGTDVSAANIEAARTGLYPATIAEQVAPERLARYFTQTADGYRVGKELRECCVFACQELGADPPFSRLDLISCRNVLIYFGRPLQNRVIETFHYALKPGRFLFLGRSESLTGHASLFRLIDKRNRIYARLPSAKVQPLSPLLSRGGAIEARTPPRRNGSAAPQGLSPTLERALLDRYAPPGFFVEDNLQIRAFFGNVGPYLRPTSGEADLHLGRMLAGDLALDAQVAVRAARKKRRPVQRETALLLPGSAEPRPLVLTAIPVAANQQHGAGCLVTIEAAAPAPASAPGRSAPLSARERSELARLKRLLAAAREQLQTVIADQDAASRELRVAHEELRSGNEELQTSNEELQTAKEELQSANEELTTVNEELQKRNEELDRLTEELGQLLAGVNIPIVHLDREGRVRRFSPAARAAFNLTDGDNGRPFAHIRPPIMLEDLDRLIARAMQRSAAIEREVKGAGGRWFSLRLRSYGGSARRPDGVLIALVDIDAVKRTAAAIVETIDQPLVVLDGEHRILTCNPAFVAAFRIARKDVEGCKLLDLGNGQWNLPELQRLLERARTRGQHFENFRFVHSHAGGAQRTFLLSARHLLDPAIGTETLLLAFQDITEREADVARARRLRTAAELEARRIARDLHDLCSGSLAALALELDRFGRMLPESQQAVAEGLRAAKAHIDALARGTQELARRLHPSVLDDLGLVEALRGECESFGNLHALRVRFRHSGAATRLPPDVALCLYRIAQEALHNVARHAQATSVDLRLDVSRQRVRLLIADDGSGFDPAALRRPRGLGLLSMAERAAAVRGTLTVDAAPGAGTRIRVEIPLNASRPRSGRRQAAASGA